MLAGFARSQSRIGRMIVFRSLGNASARSEMVAMPLGAAERLADEFKSGDRCSGHLRRGWTHQQLLKRVWRPSADSGLGVALIVLTIDKVKFGDTDVFGPKRSNQLDGESTRLKKFLPSRSSTLMRAASPVCQ